MKKAVLLLTVLMVIVSGSACSSISVSNTPTPASSAAPAKIPEPTVTPLPSPTDIPELKPEEKIALCETLNVADVKASPDSYLDKYVKATGVLIDFISGEDQYEFLIAENGDKTKLWELYIEHSKCPESFVEPKIGDTLTGCGSIGTLLDWKWGETDYDSVPCIFCFEGGIE